MPQIGTNQHSSEVVSLKPNNLTPHYEVKQTGGVPIGRSAGSSHVGDKIDQNSFEDQMNRSIDITVPGSLPNEPHPGAKNGGTERRR